MSLRAKQISGMSRVNQIRNMVLRKYPDSFKRGNFAGQDLLITGVSRFDNLFPLRGIPYGQLIEITGGLSSGKTGLTYTLLAREINVHGGAYMDLPDMFFPDAAMSAGIDINRLLLAKPNTVTEAIRTTELLLRHQMTRIIICDLVGQTDTISVSALHRLRTFTVRGGGMIIFLTECPTDVIPPSMVSLRIKVSRKDNYLVLLDIIKSRISREGVTAEVNLYGR